MKHLRYILPFVLLLLLVSVCHAEFYAYLEGDTVQVTDEARDAEPITELILGKGETLFVEVRGGEPVDFATSDVYIARVDSTGALIGVKQGSTKIKIFYEKDKYVQLRCTVKNAPEAVNFESGTLTLAIEETRQVFCAVNEGAAGAVTLYSLDEGIVQVNSDGTVSAVGLGETDLVAQTYNDVTGTCHVTVTYPAPATIQGSGNVSGYEGESLLLDCVTAGGYHETLSYESLTPDVAAVDESGVLSFIKTGTAVVRVSASGGASKDVNIIVYPGSTAIAPAQYVYTLYTGGTAELTAFCVGGSGLFSVVSGDESIISASGTRITAVGEGSTAITLVTPNGVSCQATVNVLRFPLDVSLRVEETNLAVGETVQAEYMDDTQVHLPVTFASSDASVCSVNGEGLITALSEGMAEITLTCGGVTQFADITVLAPASGIYFEPDTLIMGTGDVAALGLEYVDGGGRVSYTVSDDSIVQVSDGWLTALAPGGTVVTAALSNGQTAMLSVTVRTAPQKLSIGADAQTMCVGDTLVLPFDADGDTWSQFEWTSSDSRVADVTDGTVTANRAGETVISVTASNGLSAQTTVTVAPAHELLSINAQPVSSSGSFTHYLALSSGETYQLAVDCCLTYSCVSADPGIANVSEEGMITAFGKGTAKITVTAACGATAVLMVEVK